MVWRVGKPDGGLCHETRALLERALPDLGLAVVGQDVRLDPTLEAHSLFEIPVLSYEGHELVRHRTTEAELRRRVITALPDPDDLPAQKAPNCHPCTRRRGLTGELPLYYLHSGRSHDAVRVSR